MATSSVTPVPESIITFDDIKKMSGSELREKLKDTTLKAQIEQALAAKATEQLVQSEVETIVEPEAVPPVPTAEEVAAEAAALEEKAKAEKVEADRVEAERLAAEKKAEEERIAAEAAKPKEKLVYKFQAKDENGNPLGKLTYLVADTQEELDKKKEEAYEQSVRALHRVKSKLSKVTLEVKEPEIPVLSEADRIEVVKQATSVEDKDAAREARLKLKEDDAAKAERAARLAEINANERRISLEFMSHHLTDFNPCTANATLMGQYIKDNNLAWTVDNLELAFDALEFQLAPVPVVAAPQVAPVVAPSVPEPVVQTPQAPPANPEPTPAITVVTAPEVVAPVPATPPVSAPNPPAQVRKVPDGGLVPGESLSGVRPVSRPTGLTKQDIAKMSKDDFKKNLRDPNFRKQLNAIGIATPGYK